MGIDRGACLEAGITFLFVAILLVLQGAGMGHVHEWCDWPNFDDILESYSQVKPKGKQQAPLSTMGILGIINHPLS